jgi:hypothetical protein
MKYVIIGNGVAGTEAALTIRKSVWRIKSMPAMPLQEERYRGGRIQEKSWQ